MNRFSASAPEGEIIDRKDLKNETENASEQVERWKKKITAAEKKYEDYHNLVKEIREYYKNAKKKNKQNIFWSSVETLKPFLYFKQPKPYIRRKEKNADPVQALACKILEKALEWDLEQFDFDSVIKYARNDFLLSGMGVVFEQYKADFSEVDGVDVKKSEYVETVYLSPLNFLADSEKVDVWEDVSWIAKIIYMTKQEVLDAFGKEVEDIIVEDDREDYQKKNTKVYEIWDKESQTIYYLSKECKSKFLKVTEDPLKIKGFFNCPKPIFATLANDGIIPVPDYSEIKEQLDELDGVTGRMKKIMQALKVSGCYNSSFPELNSILSKDVTLVSVSDFDRLKEAGGIKGIIDFVPIEQYVNALASMAERRQDLTAQIYEITGVSDIMRGNSDANETATAVTKKTNFGTLRNQDRQNDMQRFILDLFKIKAEIICEQFSPDMLAGFLDTSEETTPEVLSAAVQLLKTEKMRGMVLGIETDVAFNQDAVAEKTMETVKTINDMVTSAFQAISAQPKLLPLYRKMVESVVVTLPNARQFEPVIETTFQQIEQDLNQPQEPQPTPEEQKVQIAAQKNQQEFQIKQEQNRIKQEELALKKQIEDNKVAMTNKEAEMQYALKQQEIAAGLETNANITTGYVKGF